MLRRDTVVSGSVSMLYTAASSPSFFFSCNVDEGDEKGGKQNRNEKKARKALSKVGLKPIGPVSKVTVKKSKQVCASTGILFRGIWRLLLG